MDNLIIPSHLLEKWADQAVSEGHARRRLSHRVYEYMLAHCKHHQRFEIEGKTYTPKQYVDLIAHTALQEAQAKATLKSCRQYENDLIEVSIHPTDCEICMKYEGRVFSISGNHPIYPKLEKMPPFHPGCGHSFLPTSDIALEVRKRRGESDLSQQIRKDREHTVAEAKKEKS